MLVIAMFIGLGILLSSSKPGEDIEQPSVGYVPTYYYLGF